MTTYHHRYSANAVSLLLSLLISATSSLTMKEKIYSICEEYFECEAIAKLQDRLCVGNSLNPYWLPTASDDKCYLKLKNDYIHLDRLDREIRNRKLECINATLQAMEEDLIAEGQDDRCSMSLLGTSRNFRNANGNIVVNQCFQGSRISRQCGSLRECCTAIKECESSVAKTVIAEERTARARAIYKKARDCESGLDVNELKLEEGYTAEKTKTRGPVARPTKSSLHEEFASTTASLLRITDQPLTTVTSGRATTDEHPITESNISKAEINVEDLKAENLEGSGVDLDNNPILNYKENTVHGVETKVEASQVSDSDSMLDKGLIIIKFHTPNETDDTTVTMKNTEGKESIAAVADDKKTSYKQYNSKAYQKAIVGMNHEQKPMSDDELRSAEDIRRKIENDFKHFNAAYENFERLSAKVNGENSTKNAATEADLLISNKTSHQTVHNCSGTTSSQQSNTRKGLLQTLLKMIQKLYAAAKRLLENEGITTSANDSLTAEYDKLKNSGIQLPCSSKLTNDENNEQNESGQKSNVDSVNISNELPSHPRAINMPPLKEEMVSDDTAVDDTLQFKANTISNCDKYLTCRHQLFRQLDRCSMLAVKRNRAFAISTESLIQLGDQCNFTKNPEFIKLAEKNAENTQRLRQCLENGVETDDKPECLAGINIFNSNLMKTIQDNVYATERDCYVDVNSLQLACAGLRSCCPSFHRCREETSSAADENVILELTSKLATENQHCLERSLSSGSQQHSDSSDSSNASFSSRVMRDSIVL